jgi:hypothetical protein
MAMIRGHAETLARLRAAMNEGGTTVTSSLEGEFALEGGGLAWPVLGPRGAVWQIRWVPPWKSPPQNVRAYRLADGHTGFYGSATTAEEARAEALRIAGLIKAGKTRQEG